MDEASELGEESGSGVGGSVWMRLWNSVKRLDVEYETLCGRGYQTR